MNKLFNRNAFKSNSFTKGFSTDFPEIKIKIKIFLTDNIINKMKLKLDDIKYTENQKIINTIETLREEIRTSAPKMTSLQSF